jgi:hypothetical protein
VGLNKRINIHDNGWMVFFHYDGLILTMFTPKRRWEKRRICNSVTSSLSNAQMWKAQSFSNSGFPARDLSNVGVAQFPCWSQVIWWLSRMTRDPLCMHTIERKKVY